MSNNNAHSCTRALACAAMSAVLCAGAYAGDSSSTATGDAHADTRYLNPRHEIVQFNGFWKD